MLLDHPAVVGVLNEILSHQALASEEVYGFRFDTYTTLFRGVWHGMSDVPGINRYYEEANRAV